MINDNILPDLALFTMFICRKLVENLQKIFLRQSEKFYSEFCIGARILFTNLGIFPRIIQGQGSAKKALKALRSFVRPFRLLYTFYIYTFLQCEHFNKLRTTFLQVFYIDIFKHRTERVFASARAALPFARAPIIIKH